MATSRPVPDDATLRTFVGPPLVDSFRAHRVPEARIAQAITAYRAEFAARGMWDNSVFEGIPDALARLRAAGVTLLVATSKPAVFAHPITERFGLAAAVDGVFGAPPDLVASDKASFATPGVDIGLFCSTPMVALTRNVPRKQAMEMLLTGEPVTAMAARQIGLVNRVVTAGTERDAALDLARKVALKSAHTVKLGKTAFYRQAEMNLADAYRYAAEVMTENMMARDAEEGIGAFIEKRDPKWKDR